MFDPISKLLLGLATGFVFGVLLQKGRVAKYDVIMSQFFLKDWTVVKIMATAIAVGAVGVYAMKNMGLVQLHIKPAAFGGVIIGGLLFGVGIAIFGLCPGTSVAACGEGRRDAMIGVLGMLFGAGVYVALFPAMNQLAKVWGDWGKVTLADVTHTSPWLWIAPLASAAALIFYLLERRHHTSKETLVHKHA